MENEKAILLVEDDPNDILLVQRAFRKANRSDWPLPGLILLDLKLPRKSGHEVLSWLRQQPGIGHLTTVVLSSSKESEDIERAYASGVNSYLVKPVAFDALLE